MAVTTYEMTCLLDQMLHIICEQTTGDARTHADQAHAAIHELAYALAQQDKQTNQSKPMLQLISDNTAPYPFCRHPKKCAGKGYCPEEYACND